MNNSSIEISVKISNITTKMESCIRKKEIDDLNYLVTEVTNCYILIKQHNEKFNERHLFENTLDYNVAHFQSYFTVCLFDIFSYGKNKKSSIAELLCI